MNTPLKQIQLKLWHACVFKYTGRVMKIPVTTINEVGAFALLQLLEDWFDIVTEDDTEDKFSCITYSLTYTFPEVEQVAEMCGFHLRWPELGREHVRQTKGSLAMVTPGFRLEFRRSRGKQPYVSELSLPPLHLQGGAARRDAVDGHGPDDDVGVGAAA
jgi:hypothetical protein